MMSMTSLFKVNTADRLCLVLSCFHCFVILYNNNIEIIVIIASIGMSPE